MSESSKENSLQKIFSIIEHMSDMKRKLSIQEIAAALDFSTATVYRILSGLRDLGYVAQHPNKQYYLTYKLYEISGKIINRDGFVEKMIPLMNYFAMRYGGEIGLAVFNQNSIVHIINVGENVSFGSLCPMPGQSFPAYCTAAGKVFLSQLRESELRNWLARERMLPRTRHTIIDREALFEEIQKTKERGFGTVCGELYDIISCISFPVWDRGANVIGTLNFSSTADDFHARLSGSFTDDVKREMQYFGL